MCDRYGKHGCCFFPHGYCLPIWAIIIGLITWVIAFNASYGCFYAHSDLSEQGERDGLPSLDDFGFGLWSRENRNSNDEYFRYRCSAYSTDERNLYFDAAWRAARVFAILGLICVGIGVITAVLLMCFALSRIWLDIVAILWILAALFFLLTFVSYASDLCKDYGCRFGVGSGLMVAAVLLCLLMAVIFYLIRDWDDWHYGRVRHAAGTQTVTETELGDGTKKIVRTTHNGDGTKTIEESIVRARSGWW